MLRDPPTPALSGVILYYTFLEPCPPILQALRDSWDAQSLTGWSDAQRVADQGFRETKKARRETTEQMRF